jgi:hypothetical protein
MKNIKVDIKDILVIAGSLLLGYGLWRINPCIAFIAIGAEMISLGLIGSINDGNYRKIDRKKRFS